MIRFGHFSTCLFERDLCMSSPDHALTRKDRTLTTEISGVTCDAVHFTMSGDRRRLPAGGKSVQKRLILSDVAVSLFSIRPRRSDGRVTWY